MQQNLYSAVEELILEVDQLPLSERSRTLQVRRLLLSVLILKQRICGGCFLNVTCFIVGDPDSSR